MTTVRLTSDIWVSAYLRRVSLAGAFGAVLMRGDRQAGAIFLEVIHRDGVDLYAPFIADEGRAFEKVITNASAEDVTARLTRERAFDPDLWVVSVDDREGRHFLPAEEIG